METNPNESKHGFCRWITAALLLIGASTLLSGCIAIPASRAERQEIESFAGDPHLAGVYAANGEERWWNGSEFAKTHGNLGEIFRRERRGIRGDSVAISQDQDGSLTLEFRQGSEVTQTRRFAAGPDCETTSTRVIVRFKREPAPGSEEITETAEVMLARNARGQLAIVEATDASMMTGIGIPLVPAKARSVATYTFDPAPSAQ